MAVINATDINKEGLQATGVSFENLNVTEISVGDKVIGIVSVPVKGQEGIAPPFYKGESAYSIAVKYGFAGTEQEWIESLKKPALDAANSANQATLSAILASERANTAETERVTSELGRKADETARRSAESERQTAEFGRATAEAVRVQAENERETAETTRISNENNRVTAEQARVDAEGLRVDAENLRVSSETLRLQSEEIRISAETERKANEVERLANEASRASDELIREANESTRKQDEATRKTNENEREIAETTRVSNENNRVTAEQERVDAENLRVTAETSRETAEGLRVDAELLRQSSTQEAILNAENATENANTAAQNADDARLAIQDDLALKADQANLVQLESDVEQLAYVKIKSEAVNGNFENGLIAPFFRGDDGGGGTSTLDINSSTPISGNYDIRLTIITPSTLTIRPRFSGVDRAGNIGDKIYLHFYAKILSGIPRITGIGNGESASSIYGGDVINGRNTRIIDVAGAGDALGRIYFDGRSVWDMQMDNFMRINLTEAFGAGNEPTEEEMNLLLDILGIDFFEGEITVPAQKIMQWQLKLRTQLAGEVKQIKVEDAVQSAKIKDIESIISTMNPNQSAQLSVSGVSPLSLPKNAANGGMSVKLEGLTAENLINGKGNNLDGWNRAFDIQIVDGWFKQVNDARRPNGNYPVNIKAEDKVYICYEIYSDGAPTKEMYGVYFLSNGSLIPGMGLQKTGITTAIPPMVWSGILTLSEDANGAGFCGAGDNNTTKTGDVFFRNVRIVNLTATFGAGNEPTKEQCDLIFSDYFEGVKSFEPTGRVRSVGKNLLDTSKDGKKIYTGQADGLTVRQRYAFYDIIIGGTRNAIIIPANIMKYSIEGDKVIVNNLVGGFGVTFKFKAIAGKRYYKSAVLSSGINGVGIGIYDKLGNLLVHSKTAFVDAPANSSFGVLCLTSDTYNTDITYTNVGVFETSLPTIYEPYKETNLYLTAPELRSNGDVKDEIRKGANGYELVKRVADVVPTVSVIDKYSSEFVDIVILNIANKVWSSMENVIIILPDRVIDTYSVYSEGNDWTYYIAGAVLTLRVNVPKGHFANLAEANTYFSSGYVTHTVNIPEIIPISYGGILNSAENGTVYHEPIIADAGVYDTKMDILLTDYPIASIEEIIKYENGVDTYLNVASAVVASDGLSFTHPDLADGDLVLFTYAFDKESTNGNITATFYDSNVVKIDTVTGKAYKIEDVVTDGVLTRILTEV